MSSVLIEFHVFSRIFCGFFIKFLLIFLKLFYRFSLIFTTRIQEGSTWFAPVAARVNEITDVVGGWSRVLACILHRMFLGPNGFSTAGCAFTHEGALCIYIYNYIHLHICDLAKTCCFAELWACGNPKEQPPQGMAKGRSCQSCCHSCCHAYSSQKKLDHVPSSDTKEMDMESMKDCLRQESTRICPGKAISLA